MSCRRWGEAMDDAGRGRADGAEAAELERHLAECAECRQEKREREVIRLALGVAGREGAAGPAIDVPVLLREAASRRKREPPGLLAEVVPIARRWLPVASAVAAALVLAATLVLARGGRGAVDPAELAFSLFAPEPESGAGERFDDVLLGAVLSVGGGS